MCEPISLTSGLRYANIAMSKIIFTRQASRALRRMPKDVVRLIREKLDQVAADPYAKHTNVTRLQNRPGY